MSSKSIINLRRSNKKSSQVLGWEKLWGKNSGPGPGGFSKKGSVQASAVLLHWLLGPETNYWGDSSRLVEASQFRVCYFHSPFVGGENVVDFDSVSSVSSLNHNSIGFCSTSTT